LAAGSARGAGVGLLGGLAYTQLAAVSGFEGQSGYVVAVWMLGGLLLGAVIGIFAGTTMARRDLTR
jgi:hypothetical protein